MASTQISEVLDGPEPQPYTNSPRTLDDWMRRRSSLCQAAHGTVRFRRSQLLEFIAKWSASGEARREEQEKQESLFCETARPRAMPQREPLCLESRPHPGLCDYINPHALQIICIKSYATDMNILQLAKDYCANHQSGICTSVIHRDASC
jgi:hypothetical protein